MTSGAMFVMLSRTPTLLEQLNFPSACCHEYHTKSRANATILLKPLALATTCSVAHERARKSASRSIPPGVTAWTLEIPMAQCVPRKKDRPNAAEKAPRQPQDGPRETPALHYGLAAAQGGDRLDCHGARFQELQWRMMVIPPPRGATV